MSSCSFQSTLSFLHSLYPLLSSVPTSALPASMYATQFDPAALYLAQTLLSLPPELATSPAWELKVAEAKLLWTLHQHLEATKAYGHLLSSSIPAFPPRSLPPSLDSYTSSSPFDAMGFTSISTPTSTTNYSVEPSLTSPAPLPPLALYTPPHKIRQPPPASSSPEPTLKTEPEEDFGLLNETENLNEEDLDFIAGGRRSKYDLNDVDYGSYTSSFLLRKEAEMQGSGRKRGQNQKT